MSRASVWAAWFSPGQAPTLGERARRRITLHLIPYLFFLYILAYLDRVNISVAGLDMAEPASAGGLGFDKSILGFGAGIFFWGYWILEIPSTVSVVRLGARWVFIRILILWGLCAALTGAIGTPFAGSLFSWLPHLSDQSGIGAFMEEILPFSGSVHFFNGLREDPKYQLYFFRFMLGFFEGGFFPSVIVYLTIWFRAEDRAKAIASFMAAIPLSSMFGSLVSGLILQVRWFGLSGWRWIFILEGVAPILAGFATFFFLPDRPEKAHWLPEEEREWLHGELEREHTAKKAASHWGWVHHLGMVFLLTAVYFLVNVTSYGVSMFMPAIIKSFMTANAPSSSETTNVIASCIASLPYLVGFAAMLLNGWHSDRTGERPWHVALPMLCWSLGLWLTAQTDGLGAVPVIVMIALVGASMYAHLPAFWPIPSTFLGATAAASAIGFINMIGNLGGFFGPDLVGRLADKSGSFAPALRWLAPCPLLAAFLILGAGYASRSRGSPRAGLRRRGSAL